MSEFEVGMDVFDLRYGWGKVECFADRNPYTLRISYPNIEGSIGYTKEGKWSNSDTNPSLLLSSEMPKEWLELYPKPLTKREEIVYVNSYENKDFCVYRLQEDAIQIRLRTSHCEGKTIKAALVWEE